MMRLLLPTQRSCVLFVGVLAVTAGLIVFLPHGALTLPTYVLASGALVRALLSVLVLVGLGFMSWGVCRVHRSRKDEEETAAQGFRAGVAVTSGFLLGAVWIVADLMFSRLHYLGSIPHPPLSTALLGSLVGCGFQETAFRLVFLGGGTWVLTRNANVRGEDKREQQTLLFWGLAIVAALLSCAVYLPTRSAQYGISSVFDLPPALWVHFLVFYGVLGLAMAMLLKRYGFWTAVGAHCAGLVLWDVVWGQVWWSCLF